MKQSRTLLSSLAAASLVGGVLVCTAPTATAASGTFTQPAPTTVTFEGTGFASASTAPDAEAIVPDADGETSVLTVAAPAAGRTVDLSVRIDLAQSSMDDLDLVLVAPDERAVTLVSDVGGDGGFSGALLIDARDLAGGANPFPDDTDLAGTSGTPTDYDTTSGDVDAFPGAAPAVFATLGGSGVSGSWTLHAFDDTGASDGSVPGWSINVTYGMNALPSPSTLSVSGAPQPVTDVNLVLHDIDTDALLDTEVLLESPDGRYAHVLSDVGGGEVADLDLTLDDTAGADLLPGQTPSDGSYRPRNYADDDLSEPLGGVETVDLEASLSVFDGGPANGTWKLWVFQESCCANVTIGSWSLQITAADPPLLLPAPVAPGGNDTTAPRLSHVKLTPKRLPTGVGARLGVTSTEAATLVGRVQRKTLRGWRHVGTKTWRLRSGANSRQFYGKAAQRRFITGEHRVLLVATDATGNSSAQLRLRFRVDRG